MSAFTYIRKIQTGRDGRILVDSSISGAPPMAKKIVRLWKNHDALGCDLSSDCPPGKIPLPQLRSEVTAWRRCALAAPNWASTGDAREACQ